MTRIGIDVTAAMTQGGGIGRYTRELVRALAQVLAETGADYDVRLFSARPPVVLPVPDVLPVGERIAYRPAPLSERWLARLWQRLRVPLPVQVFTGGLDLFHSPDFVLPPVYGRIPTLLTVHDLSFHHYPETFTPALIHYLNTAVPRSVARASHILADSQATRQDLMDIWQVPGERVTVLYSGVDGRFQPVRDVGQLTAVRTRYGLGTTPYILAVGTVQPRKNYQMLMRAFAPLAAQYPHHLVIAGGHGWLVEPVLAEVAKLGLNGRVHFTGFVADADLPALYSAADLFVFPSLYEGFGLPLLEAMGCGVPVITSNTSSLPEVVGGGAPGGAPPPTAVQISPHDTDAWSAAIQSLLEDTARRASLIHAGFRQAASFSWAESARQLLQIYARCLVMR